MKINILWIFCACQQKDFLTKHAKGTGNPRYNDSVCYQRFCCIIEFAVIKKVDKTYITDIF